MDSIRLVACDMDRTLLTDDHQLPPGFWEVARELEERGIAFVPASGRPLLTLQSMFERPGFNFATISDNGAIVSDRGEVVYESAIGEAEYLPVVDMIMKNTGAAPVVCTATGAFSNHRGIPYGEDMAMFFRNLQFREDFSGLPSPVVKVSAFFVENDARNALDEVFEPALGDELAVTLGGPPWLDITNKGVTKGAALLAFADKLGIGPDQMMAFGDGLNDLEMLQSVKYSYAVADAEPEVLDVARYRTGTNQEYGVMTVLRELLDSTEQ